MSGSNDSFAETDGAVVGIDIAERGGEIGGFRGTGRVEDDFYGSGDLDIIL